MDLENYEDKIMDADFELLLLNKQPLDRLETYQKTIVWEGVEYPQKPKYYLWGKYIKLKESVIPQHICNCLPRNFAEQNWTCLTIKGQILNLLELEVNGSEIDWEGKTLDSLLEMLLGLQDKWVVIFEWHCDRIDDIYYLNVSNCLLKLKDNLKSEKQREGFIVLSKS